jgi:hypothetical protein
MAQSKVEICNRALIILGQAGVLSAGQEDQNARACDIMYDPSVRMLLEKNNWTFATRRAKLRVLDEQPVFEFQYAYALPGEYLKSQTVFFNTTPIRDSRLYSIEDGALLCNQFGDVYMKYTYSLTDPKKFSELFAEAIANMIAQRICYSLREASTAQMQLISGWAEQAMQEAKSFDSMNQSSTVGFPSEVVSAKY